MSIYDLIADNYSEIFPADKDRTEFIKSFCTSGSARILDAGCSTGDLALELTKAGHNVTGIDLNKRMISIAKEKAKGRKNKPDFRVMDMMDTGELGSFDLILCFGNTLPHLNSADQVRTFFRTVNKSLLGSGRFIFQILNYDRILSDGKIDFPVIEKPSFIFTRRYTSIREDTVVFEITFGDKKSGTVSRDSTRLLPLRQGQVAALLKDAGFSGTDIYTGYDRKRSGLKEFASLYVCKSRESINKPRQ